MKATLTSVLDSYRVELGDRFEHLGEQFLLKYNETTGWSMSKVNGFFRCISKISNCYKNQANFELVKVVKALKKEEKVDRRLYLRIHTLWTKIGGSFFGCKIEPISYQYHQVKISLECAGIDTAMNVEGYVADIQKNRGHYLLLGRCLGVQLKVEVIKAGSAVKHRFEYLICISTPIKSRNLSELMPGYMNVFNLAKLHKIRVLGMSLIGVFQEGYSIEESLEALFRSIYSFKFNWKEHFDEIKVFVEGCECFRAVNFWELTRKKVFEGEGIVETSFLFPNIRKIYPQRSKLSLPGAID